ncbi:MAG: ATP synthase F1 subunit delta [Coriobacteriales bacterium]|jgi:F-type H+-transporting ATPase subunit delta|nr:ATP synthase F1 subunit delta [Coriobacteriales bacterium]
MPTDRIVIKKESAIYAEALLEAARQQDAIFALSGQLETVLHAVRGSIDLRATLADRTIPAQTRSGILREVFASLDPSLLAVLTVLVERDDIALLSRVNDAYVQRAEEALDAVIIDVVTVIELDDELREKIIAKYSAQLGRQVLLREQVDPSIVGGIVLSTHGRRIDASVVSQLENARTVLSTVSNGGER